MNLVTGRRDVLSPARRALNRVSLWISSSRYDTQFIMIHNLL